MVFSTLINLTKRDMYDGSSLKLSYCTILKGQLRRFNQNPCESLKIMCF